MIKYKITKKQRQEWWKSLSPDQKEAYIKKRQDKKTLNRKKRSPIRYNVKDYPWLNGGVNSSNREQWLAMIKKKNPWLNNTLKEV